MKLIEINVSKKLSVVSLVFMGLSFLLSICMLLYELNFKMSFYDNLILRKESVIEALSEFYELVLLFTLIFVIILALMEIAFNVENFDAFFISRYHYNYFLMIKLISSYLIIFVYYTALFLSAGILFTLKFQDLRLLDKLFRLYVNLSLYAIIFYNLAFILIKIFKNYFATLGVFFAFWLSKFMLDSKVDKYLKYVIPRLNYDLILSEVSFNLPYDYLIFYLVLEVSSLYLLRE